MKTLSHLLYANAAEFKIACYSFFHEDYCLALSCSRPGHNIEWSILRSIIKKNYTLHNFTNKGVKMAIIVSDMYFSMNLISVYDLIYKVFYHMFNWELDESALCQMALFKSAQ